MNITKATPINFSLKKTHTGIGARMIAGCVTGLIAATLIFVSPEVGIAGAIGGVAMGVVSAVLVRPHA
jgi:membrane associated rhomboid family serine protease